MITSLMIAGIPLAFLIRRARRARKGLFDPRRLDGSAGQDSGCAVFVISVPILLATAWFGLGEFASVVMSADKSFVWYFIPSVLLGPTIVVWLVQTAIWSQLDFLMPRWCRSDIGDRIEGIADLTDTDILYKIAETDPDHSLVRRAAAERLVAVATPKQAERQIVKGIRRFHEECRKVVDSEYSAGPQCSWWIPKLCQRHPDVALRLQSSHEHRDVQTTLSRIMGDIGNRDAVEPLLRILRNSGEEDYPREQAARSLGKIGDSRAVEPLIAFLCEIDRKNGLSGAEAEEALGRLGDPRAVPILVAAARRESHVSSCYAARQALAAIRGPEADAAREELGIEPHFQEGDDSRRELVGPHAGTKKPDAIEPAAHRDFGSAASSDTVPVLRRLTTGKWYCTSCNAIVELSDDSPVCQRCGARPSE